MWWGGGSCEVTKQNTGNRPNITKTEDSLLYWFLDTFHFLTLKYINTFSKSRQEI